MEELVKDIESLVAKVKTITKGSRELSLVVTKLEEAKLWATQIK